MTAPDGKLRFSDLGYGFLNNVEDKSTHNTVDPRRADGLKYLQNAIQNQYQPNAVGGLSSFTGIVMNIQQVKPSIARRKEAILEQYAVKGVGEKAADFVSSIFGEPLINVYKVYIPEIEPRPAPMSAEDPVVFTYFDVYLAPGVVDEPNLYSVVTVHFENLDNFSNPEITSVGKTIAFAGESGTPSGEAHRGSPSAPGGNYPSYTPRSLDNEEVIEASECYDTEDIPNKSQQAPVMSELHPDFLPYIKTFICKCWEKGITIQLNSGYRSSDKQKRLYRQWVANGKRGPAPSSGFSYHNFGMAIDFNPTLSNGTKLGTWSSKATWHRSGVVSIGESLGLYWGGNFRTNYDPIHFDFRNTLGRNDRKPFAAAAAAAGNAPNKHPIG